MHKYFINGDEMCSILQIGNNKSKCQKFTPDSLVETMLDMINYKNNLMGKTIIENSFGTGNIIKAIVKRYIHSALECGYDALAISKGLSQDVYGIELDKELYNNCICDLNSITDKYHIPKVDWKLFNKDALQIELDIKFDYVIGNPPYISYKEISPEIRKIIREKYKSCSCGKFDYCYAFIELGISLLKETGKLVQLIPNNIYKNVFAQGLRDLLVKHISMICDYPNQKLFDKTLTSVSIFLYDKEYITDNISYENKTLKIQRIINRKSLSDKWIFLDNNLKNEKMIRFGDVFNASISVATLYNDAFLIDKEIIEIEQIEPEIIRRAVSPKLLQKNQYKYIIFPYKYDDTGLVRFTVNEFEKLYPGTCKHLKKFSDNLQTRNSDKNASCLSMADPKR